MKLKQLIFIMVMLHSKPMQAQQQGIRLGELAPEITFNIFNEGNRLLSLSELRGKVVLLDFWNSHCTSCMYKFPSLDTLQREYGDRLKIILVNSLVDGQGDDEHKVDRIMKNYQKTYGKPIGLSVAFKDTIAKKHFPHHAQPHVAWIDKEGRVAAITSGGEVSRQNIELLLQNKTITTTLKDDHFDSNRNQQLFTINKAGIKYKSMLTGYLDGIRDFQAGHYHPFFDEREKGVVRFFNQPLQSIYSHALKDWLLENRWIFEAGADKEKFFPQGNVEEWGLNNSYCYELIAEGKNRQELTQIALNELAEMTGHTVTKENRKIPCWIVSISKEQENLLKKKTGKQKNGEERLSLTGYLEAHFQQLDKPVITESNFNDKLFVETKGLSSFRNFNRTDLEEFIRKYGLTITEGEREFSVFVVRKCITR